MKKVMMVIVSLAIFLVSQNAFALIWDYNGYYSGDVSSGLTVGTGNVGDPEFGTSQPIQISGAGTLLPAGYPGFYLNFHFIGSTWDSYNAETIEGTGYLDVFAAVLSLSENGYYWNLNTGIHPLKDNPQLIFGIDPYSSEPGPENSYWGGENFHDGILESEDEDVTLIFNTDPAKQYYLTLFMQTMEDEDLPSWGTIRNMTVNPIPEPASLTLLGIGLLGFFGFRKKK